MAGFEGYLRSCWSFCITDPVDPVQPKTCPEIPVFWRETFAGKNPTQAPLTLPKWAVENKDIIWAREAHQSGRSQDTVVGVREKGQCSAGAGSRDLDYGQRLCCVMSDGEGGKLNHTGSVFRSA